MKNILIVIVAILSFSCSKNVNPYLEDNRVIMEYNTHYSNDSLKVAATFPGDIDLSGDSITAFRRKVNRARTNIRKIKKREVLIYGTTTTSPHYQLLLAVSERPFERGKERKNTDQTIIAMEKKLDNHYILLVGSTDQMQLDNMMSDMSGVMSSINYGEFYEPKSPKPAFQVVIDELDSNETGSYLRAYLSLLKKKDNYHNRDNEFTYQQAILTSASMFSNSPLLDSIENSYEVPRRMQLDIQSYDSIGLVDSLAIQKILQEADSNYVIMFNELHWDRRHRYQVLKLLPELKNLGYSHLAMEAVLDKDKNLNQRGYPVKATGFYTKEPIMAHIIRTALDLGLEVVGYEHYGEGNREENQAKNLYDKTFSKNPLYKVIVLAGIGHIHEKMDGNKFNMAAIFKKTFSIDPVTVDQHTLGMSADVLEIFDNHDKLLLSHEELTFLAKPGIRTDYYLGTEKKDNYILQDFTQEISMDQVNSQVIDEESPVMSQLYFYREYKSEGDNAIPLYNHLGIQTTYKLAPGRYHWQIVNAFGDVLQEEDFEVK